MIAIGARSSLPSPSPTAIGKSPSTVVDVVMRIGRNRSFPASFKAAMVSTRTLASAEKEGWANGHRGFSGGRWVGIALVRWRQIDRWRSATGALPLC